MTKYKKFSFYVILITAILFICLRIYRQVIPWGLPANNIFDYVFDTWQHGRLFSPDNSHYIIVHIYDAGAAHSGDFLMWVSSYSWLWGRSIVTQGWVEDSSVVPIEWLDSHTFIVSYTHSEACLDYHTHNAKSSHADFIETVILDK